MKIEISDEQLETLIFWHGFITGIIDQKPKFIKSKNYHFLKSELLKLDEIMSGYLSR